MAEMRYAGGGQKRRPGRGSVFRPEDGIASIKAPTEAPWEPSPKERSCELRCEAFAGWARPRGMRGVGRRWISNWTGVPRGMR